MSSSISWEKMQNKMFYFYCKNKLQNGYDQINKCAEGTFMLFSILNLCYLVSCMEFVSGKN